MSDKLTNEQTNEELAIAIQGGEDALLPELWRGVERLVYWQGNRTLLALGNQAMVEMGDLVSSGYLAMVDAAASYQSDKGSFSTWFMLYLKKAFAVATGWRTTAQKNEPCRHALSLSAPLTEDANAGELAEILPDPTGERGLVNAEEKVFIQQLHDALEAVLHGLPDRESAVLRLYYFGGQTFEEVGQSLGISAERARQSEKKAIRHIIREDRADSLLPFMDFNYYAGTGLQAFREHGMSAQEWILQQRERREELDRQRRAEQQREQLLHELDVLARGGCRDDFQILGKW